MSFVECHALIIGNATWQIGNEFGVSSLNVNQIFAHVACWKRMAMSAIG